MQNSVIIGGNGLNIMLGWRLKGLNTGLNLVKELLSTLTSDERLGVMLEFEDTSPDKFAQLVADAPDWVEWMG
ncbi:hypothetical protein LC613_36150 [Nostoc sphaeroides CHAB 2801]|uniref:hypothetical protein n=1 Tax=Nostoc sphaeroides TaxID=446679 RepID=UPI001E33184D|nr:hypothetical protein [Nostoc sphaeroides]MCC5632969.1 hypothetical protein [Nostoc sphaeroides CHAB 2801]